uniref:Uncharacterized protein n=1 Tax=Oryza glumipatula TaxID=40148 RepID=A0A0D9ZH02_9ORYZ
MGGDVLGRTGGRRAWDGGGTRGERGGQRAAPRRPGGCWRRRATATSPPPSRALRLRRRGDESSAQVGAVEVILPVEGRGERCGASSPVPTGSRRDPRPPSPSLSLSFSAQAEPHSRTIDFPSPAVAPAAARRRSRCHLILLLLLVFPASLLLCKTTPSHRQAAHICTTCTCMYTVRRFNFSQNSSVTLPWVDRVIAASSVPASGHADATLVRWVARDGDARVS